MDLSSFTTLSEKGQGLVTKDELVEVVDYAYALWSKPPLRGDVQKQTCRVWWDALGDLDAHHVRKALVFLSGEREFLARPAQVRRLVIDWTAEEPVPPCADEAWEIWLDLSRQVNHGTAQPTPLHPLVADTIRKLRSGDTKDRHHFVALYEAQRAGYDQKRYA